MNWFMFFEDMEIIYYISEVVFWIMLLVLLEGVRKVIYNLEKRKCGFLIPLIYLFLGVCYYPIMAEKVYVIELISFFLFVVGVYVIKGFCFVMAVISLLTLISVKAQISLEKSEPPKEYGEGYDVYKNDILGVTDDSPSNGEKVIVYSNSSTPFDTQSKARVEVLPAGLSKGIKKKKK